MLSSAHISPGLRCEKRMRVQSHLHSRFPKSKKPKNSKNRILWPIFWYNFVTVSGRLFEKPQKHLNTYLFGIKCCQSLVFCLIFTLKIECELKVTFTIVSQRRKNRKKSKNHCFGYREFCRGKIS